jgi:uncharacterized protein
MSKNGEFCWNELMTNDVEQAKEFYTALFGWQAEDHDMGYGFTYTMIKQGDKDLGGMMRIPSDRADQIPPHWMSYVYVDDLEQAVTKAKSLGAKIAKEPMAVADFGSMAVIQDPTGAYLALWHATRDK